METIKHVKHQKTTRDHLKFCDCKAPAINGWSPWLRRNALRSFIIFKLAKINVPYSRLIVHVKEQCD